MAWKNSGMSRGLFRPASIASSSRRTLINPSADRYIALRAFLIKQSTLPPSIPQNRLLPLRSTTRFSSTQPSKPCPNCPPPPETTRGHAQEYTPFIQRLIHKSQVIANDSQHRPSKEELLAVTSGWSERLRVRLKWFTIRGWRRFNADDLSAFASWFLVGNSEWSVAQ